MTFYFVAFFAIPIKVVNSSFRLASHLASARFQCSWLQINAEIYCKDVT